MHKAVKKIKKIMAAIDKIEAKEETLREDLSEAVDELEELDENELLN
tara:strand:- start:120 stop:260 length:141 start_codon:yes stop_codon:yes gene_type:complete